MEIYVTRMQVIIDKKSMSFHSEFSFVKILIIYNYDVTGKCWLVGLSQTVAKPLKMKRVGLVTG